MGQESKIEECFVRELIKINTLKANLKLTFYISVNYGNIYYFKKIESSFFF